MSEQFSVPPGLVVVTSHGSIVTDTAFALMAMRSYTEQQGLVNIQYAQQPGALVDKVRNDAARTLLKSQAQWLFFLDGDMAVEPTTLHALLATAFHTHPHFDVVGCYTNLRGGLGLPTIDTGTGTWEKWYPGSGVVEVMRTGAACVLIKRHVFERVPDPWFALRVPMRPLDALTETDTFCRTIFDGRNPFRGLPGNPWEQAEDAAARDPSAQTPWVPAEVGEDSSFCDRVTHAGLRIAVNTDIVVTHLTRIAQDWTYLRDKLEQRDKEHRWLSGMES
jgi:hypothetical protein